MSEISERYRRLAAEFTETVENVPAERWDAPSPCADWTARQVLDHVIDVATSMAGYVGLELPAGPPVSTDPGGGWSAARDGMRALLDDPATAGLEYEGYFGRTSLERTVDGFLCFDLVVHRWDIARATGGDERMDPVEVRWIRSQAEGFGEAIRSARICGPEVPVPPSASEQDRLLAFLGRQP
jgi:uncharacterized protein (TIGR03086 family)